MMQDTLAVLDRAGIAHAGAGMDRADAHEPARLVRNGARVFARAVIEAGADVFWGHSAHVVQGVEFHHGERGVPSWTSTSPKTESACG